MNQPSVNEVKEAVEALKINKPIMKITKKGKTITLYLYGGDVIKYTLRSKAASPSPKGGQALKK
jgi:hypothetical protein